MPKVFGVKIQTPKPNRVGLGTVITTQDGSELTGVKELKLEVSKDDVMYATIKVKVSDLNFTDEEQNKVHENA